MSRSEQAERSDRIAALVGELDAEVVGALGDGGIAALDPAVSRRLVGVAARCHAVAAEEGAEAPRADDLTPTEAVVLASAVLRAHDLNPFDLALWFSRGERSSR